MSILIPVVIILAIGLIAGIVLTIASNVMKVSGNVEVEKVREALPGANCGACGYAGCDDYASALVLGENISPNLCPVGGGDLAIKIASILGVEATDSVPMVASVLCQGFSSSVRHVVKFDNDWSCRATNQLYGGRMMCRFGCLGQGDCVTACPHNAIKIVDGLAVVDNDLCIGCGLCITSCPKDIIRLHEKKKRIYVACQSQDTGFDTVKSCTFGCVACGKCVESCKFDAIKVENNLAVIDYDKCVTCGACAKVCETNTIVFKK